MLRLKESLNKLAAFKEANASRFKISRMGLFGSVARQENTEDSDIDIVVLIFAAAKKLKHYSLLVPY